MSTAGFVISALLLATAIVSTFVAVRSSRRKLIVNLSAPAMMGSGPVREWGLAEVTVTNIGRPATVASIDLDWTGEGQVLTEYGMGPLTASDLGLPTPLPPGLAELASLGHPLSSVEPRLLTDGESHRFLYKVYTHDPAWRLTESDHGPVLPRTTLVARVNIADGRTVSSAPSSIAVTPLGGARSK